jgi:uncharacterized protein YkwD
MNKTNLKIKHIYLAVGVAITLNLAFVGLAFASEINPKNVLKSINTERTNRGLSSLKEDSNLDFASTLKTKDMLNRDYFDHYANGLTPWDFFRIADYDYLYAGENLAMDFVTSEGMVKAWMNSPKHRENILNPDYADIGIVIVKGEYNDNGKTRQTIMVTNMFGHKKPAIVRIYNYIAKNIFSSF